jgi:hypothetical protein
MKFRLLGALSALLVWGGVARAQVGIYVAPVFARAANTTADAGVYAFLGPNRTSRVFSGAEFGVYDQFVHSGKLDAGIDLRGSFQQGGGAHLNEFLIGARVAYRPESFFLKPYAEVLGGSGNTRAATNPVSRTKATYGGFAGLEWSAGKHVDLRVIEVGYSSLTTISTALATAQPNPPGAASLLHFSAGIVFRLPQPKVPGL